MPEPAAGGMKLASFTFGGIHMCGLDPCGTAYCWGGNDFQQCGPGCGPTPTAMYTDHRFTWLSAGRSHTCGIDDAGTAYCWGSNAFGALGSTSGPSLTFNKVEGGPYSVIGAAQDNTCALTTKGAAFCWGLDSQGQLGSGKGIPLQGTGGDGSVNPTPVFPPTPVAGGHVFTSLNVEAFEVCAIDTAGGGWCWGFNSEGELTTGGQMPVDYPVRFNVPSGVVLQEIVGGGPICALSAGGQVSCAGADIWQPSGPPRYLTPDVVSGLPPIAHITGGDDSENCALTVSGSRYCWGHNGDGRFGDGTDTDRPSPELIP